MDFSTKELYHFSMMIAITILGVVASALAFLLVTEKKKNLKLQMGLRDVSHIANGDLRKDLQTGKEPISHRLWEWENQRLRQTLIAAGCAKSLATELQVIFHQTDTGMHDIAQKNQQIGNSTSEVSLNTRKMMDELLDLTAHVSQINSEVSVYSASVEETSKIVENSANLTNKAETSVHTFQEQVKALAIAADEINSVVELISDVASQTNLLALNATIEAATAGEAGKGFAVVAAEVKDLARQSEQSAQQIRDQIEGVHKRVSEALKEAATLAGTIQNVNQQLGLTKEKSNRQVQATEKFAREISDASEISNRLKSGIDDTREALDSLAKDLTDLHISTEKESKVLGNRGQNSVNRVHNLINSLEKVVGKPQFEAPFDILAIKKGHMDWFVKMQGVMTGTLNLQPHEVTDHHGCMLGKWYDSEGERKLGGHPQFRELGKHHEAVHSNAKKLVEAMKANKVEEARACLDSFEEARNHLFHHLDDLYSQN